MGCIVAIPISLFHNDSLSDESTNYTSSVNTLKFPSPTTLSLVTQLEELWEQRQQRDYNHGNTNFDSDTRIKNYHYTA